MFSRCKLSASICQGGFASPYYQAEGVATARGLEKAGNLRTSIEISPANPNVRIIMNHNDFLLTQKTSTGFTPPSLRDN
jgi:hypothetical protein